MLELPGESGLVSPAPVQVSGEGHPGFPDDRADRSLCKRAELCDEGGKLHSEGADDREAGSHLAGTLSEENEVVREEPVHEQQARAARLHARQERNEVGRPRLEALERGNSDPVRFEPFLLEPGELRRARRRRIEDRDVPGRQELRAERPSWRRRTAPDG